ncbi:uncharacterized protein [Triticum aestivum]|uniref:uncharacterized protein isoform X2 n=1 Tax=Triticum aestivum TaxID=4565 RepID=UPI001D03090B|nr:uncharacterized protein LOC123157546 isoform X2 [Triticum aestivum]XP_044431769.1 uncharacterized protein LOC123157546 isoform X2 [Triticum aestivum]
MRRWRYPPSATTCTRFGLWMDAMVPVMLLCWVLSSWILEDTKGCGHGPHSLAELSYWLHSSNLQDLSMEFKGYVFKIMSGCNKLGFPMKQEVLTSGTPSASQGATVVARPCGSIYLVVVHEGQRWPGQAMWVLRKGRNGSPVYLGLICTTEHAVDSAHDAVTAAVAMPALGYNLHRIWSLDGCYASHDVALLGDSVHMFSQAGYWRTLKAAVNGHFLLLNFLIGFIAPISRIFQWNSRVMYSRS